MQAMLCFDSTARAILFADLHQTLPHSSYEMRYLTAANVQPLRDPEYHDGQQLLLALPLQAQPHNWAANPSLATLDTVAVVK